MKNRRNTVERRTSHDKEGLMFSYNRRYRVDRRLNSIEVEWIPIDSIRVHPFARLVFSRD